MTIRLRVILVLMLAVGVPSCGDKEHDHDHAAKPAAGHDHELDHDHNHGHSDEVKLTPEAIKLAKIRVEPVKKHMLTASFSAPARLAFNAEAMAHIGSLVSGRVVEIKVRVGDEVKKDDVLLVVESMELGQAQSDYLQKTTELAIAQAAVEPAKQAFNRAKKLHDETQGIALAEVQKRQADAKAAEGHMLAAKAAATAALNRLLLLGVTKEQAKELEEKGTLDPRIAVRAPIDGRVIERKVTLGELVAPDKERLLVLADTGTMWVWADVPEARLSQIGVGTAARVQMAASPDQRLEGKVAQIAPALNPDTRAGRVRIDMPNTNGALRPGMFASVLLTAGAAGGEAVLAVPDEAVQTVEGSPAVFVPVEGEENTFAKRAVTVGAPVGGMVPILSGLKEGESAVVAGTFILKAELGKSEAGHQH